MPDPRIRAVRRMGVDYACGRIPDSLVKSVANELA